jgi:hypothetical protein
MDYSKKISQILMKNYNVPNTMPIVIKIILRFNKKEVI